MVDVAEAPSEAGSLSILNTAVAEFDRVAAGIGQLESKYKGVVFDVSTPKGMKEACEARAAIREPRYEVERVRKAVKAPLLKLSKEIDGRAAEITEKLLEIEEPVDQQIKAEEARKEAEKQARIAAEVKRVADIQERIAELRGNQLLTPADGSKLIAEHIADLERIAVDESFAEFRDLAAATKAATLERLNKLLTAAQAHEAEQERIRLEREELARQRQAQEEANRKQRERIAAEEAEARRKREAEEAQLRAQREENERVAKAQRDAAEAEQQRIAAENRRQSELAQARWGEINAIGHQVMIATVGRVGVRQGGTRECIVETLAETEAWPVTEEKFGPLLAAALSARTNACDQIRAALAAFDQAAEQRRQQEELQRQQDALAAQRAEFERQQAALAPPVAQAIEPEQVSGTGYQPDGFAEVTTVAIAEGAPVAAKEFAPNADAIAGIVASEFGVSFEQAMVWCLKAFEVTP
ncbi:MAG TPA: hypothetical protein VD932_03830 [Aquabacterium sp.]|nr:hypothetical protein [Aquabacterium sp.]